MIAGFSPLAVSAHLDALARKVRENTVTTTTFFEKNNERLLALACTMAQAFTNGRRLFTMGNGGSACDAEHMCVEFMHPIFAKRKPLPCLSLSSQSALLSALANDIDFSAVYSEQLRQLANEGDMILAISTSGMSANLAYAFEEAKKMKLITIAFTGKDGGRIKNSADWNFIVPSYSIHRIQETHVILMHTLWDLIHLALGEEDIV